MQIVIKKIEKRKLLPQDYNNCLYRPYHLLSHYSVLEQPSTSSDIANSSERSQSPPSPGEQSEQMLSGLSGVC